MSAASRSMASTSNSSTSPYRSDTVSLLCLSLLLSNKLFRSELVDSLEQAFFTTSTRKARTIPKKKAKTVSNPAIICLFTLFQPRLSHTTPLSRKRAANAKCHNIAHPPTPRGCGERGRERVNLPKDFIVCQKPGWRMHTTRPIRRHYQTQGMRCRSTSL